MNPDRIIDTRRNRMARTLRLYVLLLAVPGVAWAQAPEMAPLDDVRRLDSLGGQDAQAIRTWIQQQVDELERSREPNRFAAFRAAFNDQRMNTANTAAFVGALASETAAAAAQAFGRPETDPIVSHALARILRDAKRIEHVPGFVAGLAAEPLHVRVLCAIGLADQVAAIDADKDRRATVIAAVSTAARKEMQPVILEELYRALAYDSQVAEVTPIYLAVMDKRIAVRRAKPATVDCAEVEALEFFRRTAARLNAAQQKDLVARLGVLLRLDMERYVTRFVGHRMDFHEMDCIERRLESTEAVLVRLTGQPALIAQSALFGKEAPPDAPTPAHKQTLLGHLATWIGDAAANTPGVLNAAPWSVAVGAP